MKKRFVVVLVVLVFLISSFAAAVPVYINSLGWKTVDSLTKYDCENKRIGFVGASNTAEKNPDGTPIPESLRMSKMIEEKCPGSEVFLEGVPSANPKGMVSLVNELLENPDLDFFILNPSANGQPWPYEEYRDAVLNLAEIIKTKDINIEVIVLTNTPLKGNDFGTPTVLQNVDIFNTDLKENSLGRSDLINIVVDTYSAIENPKGSDSCGKYCIKPCGTYCLGDHLHFGAPGRRVVVNTILDTVFEKKSIAEEVVFDLVPDSSTPTTTPPTTTQQVQQENCRSSQRCKEIDEVWAKLIGNIINKEKAGKVWHAVKGWVSFASVYSKSVQGSEIPSKSLNQLESASSDEIKNYIRTNLGETYIEDVDYLTRVLTLERGCYGQWDQERGAIAQVVLNRVHSTTYPNTVKGVVTADSDPELRKKGLGWFGAPKQEINDASNGIEGGSVNRACLLSALRFMMCTDEENTGAKEIGGRIQFIHRCTQLAEGREIKFWNKVNPLMVQPEKWSTKCENPSSLNDCGGCGAHFSGQDTSSKECSLRMYKGGTASVSGAATYTNKNNLGWVCKNPPQPNTGLTEMKYSINCPAGMVEVENFCIDKYEASLVKMDGSSWSPYCDPAMHNVELKAVSLKRSVPQSNINQIQAKKACENAEKRLCTDEEWLRACQAPNELQYPYSDSLTKGTCNGDDPVLGSSYLKLVKSKPELFPGLIPVPDYFKERGYNQQPYQQHPAINQQENTVDKTGDNSGCISQDGVFDMVGNVAEWTAASNGIFRGGFYSLTEGSATNKGCTYKTTLHGTSYTDYSIGFRCCASTI